MGPTHLAAVAQQRRCKAALHIRCESLAVAADRTLILAATVRSVAQASSSVSDTAIFLSISLPHIQFISLSLLLPFGWPDFLAKMGSYISSLVSIDFGCVCFAKPSALNEDLTGGVLESGWSLLPSARWRLTLAHCTWPSSC